MEITKETAQEWHDMKWWKHCTPREIALFQLNQSRLCCPFTVFHEAVEIAAGRPVYTHEFCDPKSIMRDVLSTLKEGKS